MKYDSREMENQGILSTAFRMCTAARTAPKARGIDNIITVVLTGESKDELADKMIEIGSREFEDGSAHFQRDAKNVHSAQAVVLIGVKRAYAGLPYCSLCGFSSCEECMRMEARCAFNLIDLGIALSSAASIASDDKVDNRIMFSVGKAAEEMGYTNETDVLWHGIPLSVKGKDIFFDRK